MKKTLLLLTLVGFISVTSFVNSPGSATTQAVVKSQVVFAGVPDAVQLSFDGIVSDIMNNWYPNNSGWSSNAVSWERVKGAWVATGDILLNGSGSGITVVTSNFKNTGEFVSLNYNVLP